MLSNAPSLCYWINPEPEQAMDDLVEAAKARIVELKQQVETLEKFVQAAGPVTRLLSGSITGTGTVAGNLLVGVSSQPAAPDEAKRTRVTDNPRPAVLIPAAVQILRDRGQPMSRRELHEALSEKGLVVRGADPVKALGTILWRARDEIVQIEGRGYWPKDDPVPPAGRWMDFLK